MDKSSKKSRLFIKELKNSLETILYLRKIDISGGMTDEFEKKNKNRNGDNE